MCFGRNFNVTLIAAFELNAVPIVVADMLTSGVENPDLELPTAGHVSNLTPGRHVPSDLMQKLVIFAPNLAVGFAGDVNRLLRIVRSLKRLANEGTVTRKSWLQFLEDKAPMLNDVAMAGFLLEPRDDGTHDSFMVGWQAQSLRIGSAQMLAAGSGLGEFANVTTTVPHAWELPSPASEICTAFSFCSALLREEHATGAPVTESAAGGAYEVAYLSGNGFKKAGNVTFVSWEVEISQDVVQFSFPFLIVKQQYSGDSVLLNCARWNGVLTYGDAAPVYVPRLHVVLPPLGQQTKQAVPSTETMGFDSPVSIHTFLVVAGEQRSLLHVCQFGPEEFSFSVGNAGWRLFISQAFRARIATAVKQQMAS